MKFCCAGTTEVGRVSLQICNRTDQGLWEKKKTDDFSSVFKIKRKLHLSKIGWWDTCIKKGRCQFLTPYVQTQKTWKCGLRCFMTCSVQCENFFISHFSLPSDIIGVWKKKKDWSNHEQIIRKILRCLFVANTSHFSTLSLKVHLSCNPSIFYLNVSWCSSIIWLTMARIF